MKYDRVECLRDRLDEEELREIWNDYAWDVLGKPAYRINFMCDINDDLNGLSVVEIINSISRNFDTSDEYVTFCEYEDKYISGNEVSELIPDADDEDFLKFLVKKYYELDEEDEKE